MQKCQSKNQHVRRILHAKVSVLMTVIIGPTLPKSITYACQVGHVHWWFSGRMLACHAGGPGSIPGQCNFYSSDETFTIIIAVYFKQNGFDKQTFSHLGRENCHVGNEFVQEHRENKLTLTNDMQFNLGK